MIFSSIITRLRSYHFVYLVKNNTYSNIKDNPKLQSILNSLALEPSSTPTPTSSRLDLNIIDQSKKTALYYALKNNNENLAVSLLKLGARPELTYLTSKPGQSPLYQNAFHMAATSGLFDVVKYLIKSYPALIINPSALEEDNPFDCALKAKDFKCVELFLNYFSSNTNIELLRHCPQSLNNLVTYLIEYLSLEQSKVVLSFLENHNLNPLNSSGNNIFMQFIPHDAYYKMVVAEQTKKHLSNNEIKNAGIATKDFFKKYTYAYIEKFELFVHSPMTNINHQNDMGQNALMILVTNHMFDLADYLLGSGVNLFAVDKEGRGVLDLNGPMKTSSPGLKSERLNSEEKEFIKKVHIILEKQRLGSVISPVVSHSSSVINKI